MTPTEECLFELNYLKKEEERSGNTNIAMKRIELGRLLAQRHPVDAELIVPIPETGILFAQGYALESDIPFAHAVLKKRPKTKTLFIEHRKETIGDIIIIIPELIKNKKIVVIDETVISGLSLSIVIKMLREAQPKELHVRMAAHPMVKKCPSNSFSNSWSFLKEKAYKEAFEVDSFEFLDPKDLEKFAKCVYCFGGEKDESKVVRTEAR